MSVPKADDELQLNVRSGEAVLGKPGPIDLENAGPTVVTAGQYSAALASLIQIGQRMKPERKPEMRTHWIVVPILYLAAVPCRCPCRGAGKLPFAGFSFDSCRCAHADLAAGRHAHGTVQEQLVRTCTRTSRFREHGAAPISRQHDERRTAR